MNEKDFLTKSLQGFDTIRAAYAARIAFLGGVVVDPPIIVDPPLGPPTAVVPPSNSLLAEGDSRVGAWLQGVSQSVIDGWRALGVDMFIGHWKDLTLQQHNTLEQNGVPYVIGTDQETSFSKSTGVMIDHEPDLHPQNPPSEILAQAKAYKEGGGKQPVYIFFGKGICVEGWFGMGPSNGHPWSGAGAGFEYYKTICESPYVDGTMFDYYPFNSPPTKQKKIGASKGTPVVDDPQYVIDGLKRLKEFSNGKPVYATLAASRIKREMFDTPPSMAQNKALTQSLLDNGVDGIIWFAHDFDNGKYVTDKHPLTEEGVANGTANMVKVCSDLVKNHFSGVIVDPPQVEPIDPDPVVDPVEPDPPVIVDPPNPVVDPVEPDITEVTPFEGQRTIADIKAKAGCSKEIESLPKESSVTIATAGTVLENRHFSSGIKVKADDVTIRNCFISGEGWYGIQATFGHKNLLIENCTFVGQNSCGPYVSNAIIRDCKISESKTDGIKLVGDDVTVEGCWVFHIGINPESHADCIQIRGPNHNHVYRNNYFDIPFYDSPFYESGYKSNACFIIQADLGDISNITIENNWCRGGSYMIYIGQHSGKSWSLKNFIVKDNFCSRLASREQGKKSTLFSVNSAAKNVVIEGNLWYESSGGEWDGLEIPNNRPRTDEHSGIWE